MRRSFDPDSDDARIVKVTRRQYDKEVKVPPEWVVEFAQLTSQAHQVWAKARAENNFASFQPYLEKIVDLRRRYAEFFAPYDHVYDPLLDDFEPGMKTADVKQIFDGLRPQQVALIKAIAGRPQVDDSFLHQPYRRAEAVGFWRRGDHQVRLRLEPRPPGQSAPPLHQQLRQLGCAHHHPRRPEIPGHRPVRHDARMRARPVRAGRGSTH